MLLWPGSLGVGAKCSETRPSISSSFVVVPETFYWACVSSLQDKEPHRTASCHPQSSVFIFSKSHYWHLRCFLSKVELELWQRNLCMKNLLNLAAARFIWQMCYPLSSPTGLCSHSKVRKKMGQSISWTEQRTPTNANKTIVSLICGLHQERGVIIPCWS